MLTNLQTLSLEELLEVKKGVEKRIKELRDEKTFSSIKEDVAKRGFACYPRFNRDIPGLKKIYLPYYIKVFTYDKSNCSKDNIEVDEWDDNQLEWVDYIEPKYRPCHEDNFKIITEWDCDDWDSPAKAKAEVKIPVYYQHLDNPPEEFLVIFEDGNVGSGIIKDNKIFVDDKEICSVDKHDLFILA